MKEVESNWQSVADTMKEMPPIHLNSESHELLFNWPEKLIERLNIYKFAAKMIGSNKKVVDLNPKDGLGSYLVFKECGEVYAIGESLNEIQSARKNFSVKGLEFAVFSESKDKSSNMDAALYLDFNTEAPIPSLIDKLFDAKGFLHKRGVVFFGGVFARYPQELVDHFLTQFSYIYSFSLLNGRVAPCSRKERFSPGYYLLLGSGG